MRHFLQLMLHYVVIFLRPSHALPMKSCGKYVPLYFGLQYQQPSPGFIHEMDDAIFALNTESEQRFKIYAVYSERSVNASTKMKYNNKESKRH